MMSVSVTSSVHPRREIFAGSVTNDFLESYASRSPLTVLARIRSHLTRDDHSLAHGSQWQAFTGGTVVLQTRPHSATRGMFSGFSVYSENAFNLKECTGETGYADSSH